MVRKFLRNDPWDRIQEVLPGKVGDRGVTAADNRLFVEAVLWLLRTGAPWRDLPPEFGRCHSAYMRFSGWQRSDVWARLFKEVFLDSTAIRAHLHAAGGPQKKGRRHWAGLLAAGGRKSI